jgi:hypothetical protein
MRFMQEEQMPAELAFYLVPMRSMGTRISEISGE